MRAEGSGGMEEDDVEINCRRERRRRWKKILHQLGDEAEPSRSEMRFVEV